MSKIIIISLEDQRLQLRDADNVLMDCPVSTASKGPGEIDGSECTPRGWHVVRAKIGDNAMVNSVFVGRRLTGELYSPSLRKQYPDRDWILTRIIWLSGMEPGKNRLGSVDTMRRYIYIHGCPDDEPIGTPISHGCIRMRNDDVINLYDNISVGTKVFIEVGSVPSSTPSLDVS